MHADPSATETAGRDARDMRMSDGAAGALKIALAYAGFAALWILLSDEAVGMLFDDPLLIVRASQAKGWLFVAVTSLLLFALVMRLLVQIEQSRRREVETELERRMAVDKVHSLSYYDALTGLPNRRLLVDRLHRSVDHSVQAGTHGAVLFVDLDEFNVLNDTSGHQVGDQLLMAVGQRILAVMHGDDTVSRTGSDEFVVVANSLPADPDQALLKARDIARRIQATIAQPLILNGQPVASSASIGISLFSARTSDVDALLRQADASLFQAKRSGRAQIHFFDPGMQAALEERVQMERWLQRALPDQLRLHYQMQVDASGAILGAEALVRWEHPERGMISPAQFIPLAEQTGRIVEIGRWVLDTACRQLKAWDGHPATRALQLAVNVSAKEFRQPDFVDEVLRIVRASGAEPTRLKLELTESVLLQDIEGVIGKMKELKAAGIRFALDDFGTGFSSLSYLRQLPLDQLKIDQSFVRDELEDPNDATIVGTIIALGQSLGLDVIAEGVETAEQRDFLAARGCHQYQGYFFGRPVPLADFEAAVRRNAVPA